jgi:hypothetical protein
MVGHIWLLKWLTIRCSGRGRAAPLSFHVTPLEDHRQKRLFPTTIGGGATVKSSDKWRVTLRQAQGRLSDEQGVAAKANL